MLDQLFAYNSVLKSVFTNEGKTFFLDIPGDTGKTFGTNLMLTKFKSQTKIAIAVMSSGIAVTLLIGGRMANSIFKLPHIVSFERDSVCSIHKIGLLGKVLQDASLII